MLIYQTQKCLTVMTTAALLVTACGGSDESIDRPAGIGSTHGVQISAVEKTEFTVAILVPGAFVSLPWAYALIHYWPQSTNLVASIKRWLESPWWMLNIGGLHAQHGICCEAGEDRLVVLGVDIGEVTVEHEVNQFLSVQLACRLRCAWATINHV